MYAHEWKYSGGAAGGRAVRERNSAVPVQQAKLQVWTMLRVRVKSFSFLDHEKELVEPIWKEKSTQL